MWIEDECKKRGIVSARPGVRPVTILTPEDFEGLMALGSRGPDTVCSLLVEKTQQKDKYGALDHFLFSKVKDSRDLRLPFMDRRFGEMVGRSLARLKEFGVEDPSPST